MLNVQFLGSMNLNALHNSRQESKEFAYLMDARRNILLLDQFGISNQSEPEVRLARFF
jgi:hypothetical protein